MNKAAKIRFLIICATNQHEIFLIYCATYQYFLYICALLRVEGLRHPTPEAKAGNAPDKKKKQRKTVPGPREYPDPIFFRVPLFEELTPPAKKTRIA